MPTHHLQSRLPSTPLPKSTVPAHAPAAVKAGTQGGGHALDKHKSATLSAKFGHDFSKVRIHTDTRAEEAAGAMGANAYALGGDIVFGAGKYNPGSLETDRLLAHELTHVVQQDHWGMGDWGRMSAKGDASEREADSLASQVMMGRSVSASAAPQAAIARDFGPYDDGEKCYDSPQPQSGTIIDLANSSQPDTIVQGHPDEDAQRKQRGDYLGDMGTNPTEPDHTPNPEEFMEEPPAIIGD
jgi:hypothetical protein